MQSGKSTDFQCLELQTATLRTGCDGIDHLESTSRWRNSHDWFIMTPKTNRHLLGVASHLLSPECKRILP